MKLYRAESLNDSPAFVRAVADLAQLAFTTQSAGGTGAQNRAAKVNG